MTSPALFPLRLLGLPLVPTAGDWNMAADEWLLVRAVEAQEAALRFYAWDRATVSLGHFQQVEALPSHLATLPVVRRLSGGGAIIHDAELTYSLVLPVTHPLAAQKGALRPIADPRVGRAHHHIPLPRVRTGNRQIFNHIRGRKNNGMCIH